MDVTAFREAWPALRSTSLPLEPNSWLLHIPNEHPLQKEITAETLGRWIQQEIQESETLCIVYQKSDCRMVTRKANMRLPRASRNPARQH